MALMVPMALMALIVWAYNLSLVALLLSVWIELAELK
jgi:hypothetical protein